MTRRNTLLLSVLAPVAAVVLALAISSIVLLSAGHNPLSAYASMVRFGFFDAQSGFRMDSWVFALNNAVPLYLSAIAVALGFKMGLFNIGVEGQYQLAVLVAAWAGAAVVLPAVLHVSFIVLVAVAVGAIWSGIAGALKSGIPWLGIKGPGIHEVISTIMLNGISVGLGAFLLLNFFRDPQGGQAIPTRELPESGLMPSLNGIIDFFDGLLPFVDLDPGRLELRGFLLVAIAVGIGYHYLVNRTRFGYDLRASGINPGAARASGVDPDKMVVLTMVIGGAVAGLVGLNELLGFAGRYTIDFPTFLGFDGIAVALLGRNHPLGMFFGALLFGWLDRAAQILDLEGIPKEIVGIMRGVIVLTVVVAYAVVGRILKTRAIAMASVAGVHERVEGGDEE